jgi:phage-related protein
MRSFEFYRTDAGRCPVSEFLEALSGKEMQKVDWVMRLISETPFVPEEYFKKLRGTDDLWEVRAQSSRRSLRFLGFFFKGNLIVLTNGFDKKSQKTPKSEIDLGERRRADYFKRHR